jgi:S1-C subfamily serine protease
MNGRSLFPLRRMLLVLGVVLGIGVLAVALWPRFFASATATSATGRGAADRAQVVLPTTTPTAVQTTTTVTETQSLPVSSPAQTDGAQQLAASANLLSGRYAQLSPGVVNLEVLVESATEGQGIGAGSGFILDTEGRIVTNNHVVAGATLVLVNFATGVQVEAQVLGTDDDSDLAVVQVAELPEGTAPLPLADSSQVQVGDWAIAIGNPFGLGGTMTLGIVSAIGRSIPSGATQFNIPEAIQTDAAINPGNSGGPLINLAGEVIGVNAQILTGGAEANTGVGFAIPANVVRLVAPALIANGAYEWPWLGISGSSINLVIAEANELPNQQGAYIAAVVPGGPAGEAGLQGSSDEATVRGLTAPVGGDVVIEADGNPIANFNALLDYVAFRAPGDTVVLTVLRNGERQEIPVTLAPRPEEVAPAEIDGGE